MAKRLFLIIKWSNLKLWVIRIWNFYFPWKIKLVRRKATRKLAPVAGYQNKIKFHVTDQPFTSGCQKFSAEWMAKCKHAPVAGFQNKIIFHRRLQYANKIFRSCIFENNLPPERFCSRIAKFHFPWKTKFWHPRFAAAQRVAKCKHVPVAGFQHFIDINYAGCASSDYGFQHFIFPDYADAQFWCVEIRIR